MKHIIVMLMYFGVLPQLISQNFNPETGEKFYLPKKYISFFIGLGSGDFDLSAESAFSDPQNPQQRLWVAEVSDVATISANPQTIILKFGGWYGGLNRL